MELPVVVGADGSEHSLPAIDWAVDAAARHQVPLKIVHASLWGPYEGTESPAGDERFADPPTAAEILGHAEDRARSRQPGVRTSTELMPDDPVYALLRQGRNASAVVTGSRGRGTLRGLLLGSVSLAVAARADCPVVVARGTEPSPGTGRIVLGAGDETDGSSAAEFAFREAEARGAEVRAVRAWRCPAHEVPDHPLIGGEPAQAHSDRASEYLDDLLREPRRAHPGVQVTRRTPEGPARRVLLEESASADLLVVGAQRRHGHHLGLQLGVVNHAVLHHAPCPVAVVPQQT
ncbi:MULTISPECIES: universal stress protein [Streptomyces]|uniref:Universal stress protein n=1 Tax=Streptomyces lycii TaxID=2654337 RepID=A0ABQ7FF20_9ACTN|nr:MULTISPECIES: universal stress protein [Streptomyces]KAF4407192.1 universal stress protein [Streptomyces lycii]PGH47703.1 universal stress protein [Streptomyces sp. Ru87]